MIDFNRYISDEELQAFGTTESLSARAKSLIRQQQATWPSAGENYRHLQQVETKEIDFDHFLIQLQYNQGRIRSSAADTSATAVAKRPCFLCSQNRPAIQYGIPWKNEYVILTNPFPIFQWHLTIPTEAHIPQQIDGRIGELLELSRELDEFTIFYNGPRCGASAPDHFHFQAGSANMLPVEKELEKLFINHGVIVKDDPAIMIAAIDDSLRRFLLFRSQHAESLIRHLSLTIAGLPQTNNEEPMMNILVWYREGKWDLLLFPRIRQRPWQYFADGDSRIVMSPAAVELGGLVILPRKEDFLKIKASDLKSLFSQLCLPPGEFMKLNDKVSTF